ncbi:hypothetical protein TNCV_2597831 [Trichonephila clavipes]|nr:hypothetical protein TNCV_2597831 [Trichonephila clavipes]
MTYVPTIFACRKSIDSGRGRVRNLKLTWRVRSKVQSGAGADVNLPCRRTDVHLICQVSKFSRWDGGKVRRVRYHLRCHPGYLAKGSPSINLTEAENNNLLLHVLFTLRTCPAGVLLVSQKCPVNQKPVPDRSDT